VTRTGLPAAIVLAAGIAVTGAACSHAVPVKTLCGTQSARAAGGSYIVQNNEYGSKAVACVSTDGDASFSVTQSSLSGPTYGGPGGYPSVYQGCHWSQCSSGGLAGTPVRVSDLASGVVTTTWSTSQPGGASIYNVAYDIWFSKKPRSTGHPDCTELMVWLNHNGSVQPYGTRIAAGVSVGGYSYDVWAGRQSWGHTISYDMTTGTTSVTDLDVGILAQDATRRGYLPDSCHLVDVEAGFELWQDGTGLATNAFSVTIHRQGPGP
jgi:cellulose 1,4-beta-cellobiosidase